MQEPHAAANADDHDDDDDDAVLAGEFVEFIHDRASKPTEAPSDDDDDALINVK